MTRDPDQRFQAGIMSVFILSVPIALSVSFLCSRMEAALLRLTPSQLAQISALRRGVGAIWQRFKDNIEQPIAVMRVLNTAAHTVGALVTNNAAAVPVFPIALAAARSLSVSFMSFAIAIMIAASGGFATPIGYQTNLMVYGPGGYRFSDYVRLGVPLDLVFMAVTVLVTPLVYPFHPV